MWCFGPLCFGTVSVKQTKSESTIWLNHFIESVFAACFKVKRTLRSDDQLVIRCFSRLRTASFTVNECIELVYCTDVSLARVWECNSHQFTVTLLE